LANNKSENTLYENGIGWAILLAVFAVVIWLFWYYFDVEIRNIVRNIRYAEMWIADWFMDKDDMVLYNKTPVNWQKGYEDTPRWTKEQLSYSHLSYFAALAMQPMKMFYVGIFSVAATWCMFLGPGTEFRRKFNLESLIERQSMNFKIIRPFISFNPSTQPPRPPGAPVPAELPLFAEALGPEEWIAYNNIPVPDGKIDEAAAAETFQLQLGARWRGPNELEPYKKILLAAFCLKASRKRKDCDELLGRLALCWSAKSGLRLGKNPKLLREANRILKDKNLAAKTLAQCNRHAFETTALLRALSFAREEGGVLAPAAFVWLRGHDRTLWYPLNNMGRQSFHTEAMGAMSHYKAERMTQRPIPVPKMEDAIKTITEYMSSQRARPIPQLDYKGSKKKGIKKAV
jgi:intracellular multiplication protein IcmP